MGANDKIGNNAKAAIMNKIFYDMAACVYEDADGRRGNVPQYLEDNIWIQDNKKHDILIDIGAGTGYASNVATTYYKRVYALDISDKMLDKIIDKNIIKLKCDVCKVWPVVEKADKCIAISTLHHIADHYPLLCQVNEHLDKGGIFYSDLDIDESFVRRWGFPLKIYRSIRHTAKKYMELQPALSEELHDSAEVHSEGIPTERIKNHLEEMGYLVTIKYHWGNGRSFPKGMAPFVSIWGGK